ncbi:MAG: response regulator transcription factor [Selenomonadaceae bacterium]|nr:response regulator transcription factor [Selenomonadaceae bacterium]MDY2684981.1 response regulator transcription factor [Selenomonadaceae bacterium]
MAITVMIADDHALLRQGLKRVLNFEDDLKVVGEAEDGQETLARVLLLKPDILLLDLNMSGLTGLEVLKQMKAAHSKTKVIVLTIHDSDNYVLELLKNGALGYVLKDVDPDTLVKAIHIVNKGKPYIYPQLAERIFGVEAVEGDVSKKADAVIEERRRACHLTAREIDVLKCVAKGMSNADIGETLGVSEKTVKNHMTSIFRKLKVNDRTQALIYVLKKNLIALEE